MWLATEGDVFPKLDLSILREKFYKPVKYSQDNSHTAD